MPTLLPELNSLSVKKSNRSVATLHRPLIERVHCSPPTTNTFSPNFIKSLLSLVLVIGLFQQTTFRYTSSTGPSTEVSRACDIITRQSSGTNQHDPEVEFLELGHSINGNRTWNLYGPDRSVRKGVSPSISAIWCHSMKLSIVLKARFYLALRVCLC